MANALMLLKWGSSDDAFSKGNEMPEILLYELLYEVISKICTLQWWKYFFSVLKYYCCSFTKSASIFIKKNASEHLIEIEIIIALVKGTVSTKMMIFDEIRNDNTFLSYLKENLILE